MQDENRAYMLKDDEGDAIWFAGALMTMKASGARTAQRFSMLDQRVPPHYAVPRHIHHAEDEAWYVLEGEAIFYCGEQVFSAGPGAWVFLPRGVPHAFRVGPAGGRMLTMSAPAGFAGYVAAAGEPAPSRSLPPGGEMDIARLTSIGTQYGIEIVGPPPEAAPGQ
jgi:mannose-6-phosphate isomerase-like protein (cupin superfamily)